MNKTDKIDTLLKSCSEFRTTLNVNSIFNINDGVNAPEYINSNSAEWRVFKNQILSLDKFMGSYRIIDVMKQIVSSVSKIDDDVISDLIVNLEELKTEIEIDNNQAVTTNNEPNKSSLEVLLDEMNSLECKFVSSSPIPGIQPSETIYKCPEFLLWRSKVISELEDDTSRLAQSIITEFDSFNGWHDKKLFNNIKAELTVLVENQRKNGVTLMNTYYPTMPKEGKPHKLFISHSSKDEEYMLALVEMLENIGMPSDSFVCTSIPGYGIPGEETIFDWLREQFLDYDLRVLLALSKNYYSSSACLNEMGAAWVTKTTYSLLLLPGFDFKDIEGCVDSHKIGISFGTKEDELKHRLNEFKDLLVSEHNLNTVIQTRWEQHRDKFIHTVREIFEKKKKETKESTKAESETHLPIVGENDVGFVPVESAFLLVYAAACDGHIIKISDIDGAPPYITITGNKKFMADLSHRESARWQDALNRLVIWGWVKQCDNSGERFELTGIGYNKADMLKAGMSIDTSKEPLEEIKEFDT